MQAQPIYLGYCDGHKDSYINTDDSNKARAAAWHINYAPLLARTLDGSSPEYFVRGRAAAGQLVVFGSEPPDTDYSPLWREFIVTWKAGVRPVLLVKDDQIKALAKKGKLTLKQTTVVLNAPILKVKAHWARCDSDQPHTARGSLQAPHLGRLPQLLMDWGATCYRARTLAYSVLHWSYALLHVPGRASSPRITRPCWAPCCSRICTGPMRRAAVVRASPEPALEMAKHLGIRSGPSL